MLILGLFILLLVSAISAERINGIIINRAAALVLLYSFILSIYTLNVSIIGSGIGVFGGLYQITVLSKVVECFIYLLGAMILSNTMLVTRDKEKVQGLSADSYHLKSESSIIALFTVIGGILLITTNDLVSMYLSIELQSFGLYVLATLYRDSQAATSAGLKYFLLGGLSSGFILLGSSIIYASTGITNLESIYLLISSSASSTVESLSTVPQIKDLASFSLISEVPSVISLKNKESIFYIEIGLLIMTVGFLFKVASAPFHNWAPDVYDGVPTKVTTWLAIMAKISILTFLVDLVVGSSVGRGGLGSLFPSSIAISMPLTIILLIAAVLSLLVGTIVGLAQSRIKRLLAYSTISHVGFLLLAIAVNTTDSIESFIFYLIQYSLTSANAFFVLIAFGGNLLSLSEKKAPLNIENNNFDSINSSSLVIKENYPLNEITAEEQYSPVQFISQLKGQFVNGGTSSLLALALAVILFSMAGIPPLVGFFAKQAVLLSAVKNGFIFLALVAIVTSVISAAYYLRVIKVMVFDRSNVLNQEQRAEQRSRKEASNSLSFSISILTVLTVFFVLKPSLILNSAHIMALSLFYL